MKSIDCDDNKLTSLEITNCPNLSSISISNNPIATLDFVKELNKLEYLDINDTDISRGIEFLPSSVETFFPFTVNDFEKEVKKINFQLSDYIDDDDDETEIFSKRHLDAWREDNQGLIIWANNVRQLELVIEANNSIINDYEEIRETILHSVGVCNNQFYWTRTKSTAECLLNPHNGFLLWLVEEINSLNSKNERHFNQVEELEELMDNYYEEYIEI